MGATETIVMLEAQKKEVTHVLHLLITILFLPWAIVWIILAASAGSHNKRIQEQIDTMLLVMARREEEDDAK